MHRHILMLIANHFSSTANTKSRPFRRRKGESTSIRNVIDNWNILDNVMFAESTHFETNHEKTYKIKRSISELCDLRSTRILQLI